MDSRTQVMRSKAWPLALLMFVVGALTGACTQAQQPEHKASKTQTGDTTPARPTATQDAEPQDCCDVPITTPAQPHRRGSLDRLWRAPSPSGSGPEIALRFLQQLQVGHDFAAARQLTSIGRDLLGTSSAAGVHRVMRDVAGHANLWTAGGCWRASWLDNDSALVRCGARNVVVHLDTSGLSHGVLISAVHPRHDVYRGPHTHAYTTVNLWTLR